MSPVLETERLLLRELRSDDAEGLYAVFQDPYAQRLYPHLADRGEMEAWVARNLERYASEGFGLWGLVLKQTGELVGDCGLTLQDVEGTSELEVGWHVRADQRRRGLASEAGRACLDWGMRRTDYERIVSLVHVENPASNAVAERVHEGRLPRPIDRRAGPHWVYVTNRRSTP
ncbi:MAG: GNAT family N-acetyltransferase [Deltaproteobacteria bacterium]|nr:GNAT family N-acetyltransferase [Deltaproteobacteria bacterium]